MPKHLRFNNRIGLVLLGLSLLLLLRFTPLPGALAVAPADNEEIERLITQLGDDSFPIREKASERLVTLGKPAVLLLEKASRESSDPEIRSRAECAVQEIRGTLPFLLEQLKDKDYPLVRQKAAETLGRRGPAAKSAVSALIPLLKDRYEDVREAAVMAIIAIDPANEEAMKIVPAKASVNGKYRTLLRRLRIPEDRKGYGDFKDFGLYEHTEYLDFTDLPQGYWVYVDPYWHIWKEQVKP